MTLANPRLTARIAGVCYLMDVAFGPGMVALRQIFVPTDAARTIANLVAHKSIFMLGYTGNFIAIATYIVVVALFYLLFKPVNRTVSFVAAFTGLAGCTVLIVASAFYFAPLLVLDQPHMALVLFKLYGQMFNTSLPYFGVYCLLIGYLIYRSTFLPRWLGVLMMLGFIGGMTFLVPTLGRALFPLNMIGNIGELVLAVWLVVRSVDADRWRDVSTDVQVHPPYTT
ncbi:MAG TPA: DUF4386 domain-containing protein [Gemmatimonadaceae bacterium]